MSVLEVWNFRERKNFSQFINNGANFYNDAVQILHRNGFKVKPRKSNPSKRMIFAKAEGAHLNFKPIIELDFTQNGPDSMVYIHYYAKIRKLGIGAAIVTSGVTAVIGGVTFTVHAASAEARLNEIWVQIGQLAGVQGVSIYREGFDYEKPVGGAPPNYQQVAQPGTVYQQQPVYQVPPQQGSTNLPPTPKHVTEQQATQPGQMPPGSMPPQGQMPPQQGYPVSQYPYSQPPYPGQMPPGSMPPQGQMPPGQMPPGQMPPGSMPPQGQMPPQQGQPSLYSQVGEQK